MMITPMVARLEALPFDREGWFFELKWDGFPLFEKILFVFMKQSKRLLTL
jgi:hypothetical protein